MLCDSIPQMKRQTDSSCLSSIPWFILCVLWPSTMMDIAECIHFLRVHPSLLTVPYRLRCSVLHHQWQLWLRALSLKNHMKSLSFCGDGRRSPVEDIKVFISRCLKNCTCILLIPANAAHNKEHFKQTWHIFFHIFFVPLYIPQVINSNWQWSQNIIQTSFTGMARNYFHYCISDKYCAGRGQDKNK